MLDNSSIILILVIFNLTTMFFCFRDFKTEKEGKKAFPIYQIYIISSLFFSALGALLCIIAIGYRKNNKLFILLQVLILAIQITALIFLVPILTA